MLWAVCHSFFSSTSDKITQGFGQKYFVILIALWKCWVFFLLGKKEKKKWRRTDEVREKSNQKVDVGGGQYVKVITNIYWMVI